MTFKIFLKQLISILLPVCSFLYFTTYTQAVLASDKQGYKLDDSLPNKQVDVFLASEELSQFNLFSLDLTHRGSFYSSDIDQIYVDRNNHDNFAVLKMDLRFLGTQGVMKLSDNDFVCHGVFASERAFSLFTAGIDQPTVEKLCNTLSFKEDATTESQKTASLEHKSNIYKNKKSTANSQRAYTNFNSSYLNKLDLYKKIILQKAFANECCISGSAGQFKSLTSVTHLSNFFSAEVIMQKMGTCIADVVRGVGNVFKGVFTGVKKLFSTSPKKLWADVKQTARNIKNFVINIKDQMIQLKNAFSELDMDLILGIGCTLAGEIITSAGISALTGAGVAMLSARIIQVISKMSKLNHLFGRLNKLAKIGNKPLAAKVLSCGLK